MSEVTIILQQDEAMLFREFQKRYDIVAPIAGYMAALNIMDISNSQITLDIDQNSVIKVTKITKTFR